MTTLTKEAMTVRDVDRYKEVSKLLGAYEQTDLEVKEFAKEFFYAVQLIVRRGIPIREQNLSIEVPWCKEGPRRQEEGEVTE